MIQIGGIKAIVTDIEGTTSSLSFVKDVLFPYARDHLPKYVRTHASEVEDILNDVRKIENNPDLSNEAVTKILLQWIAEDRKITPLKTLQGLVWEAGFKAQQFKGHIYDDAADALQRWFRKGLKIYIYSSGSIAAQKLLYGYSERGDLTPLLSGYFDTTTGPKQDPESYKKIASSIGFTPAQILFLSDSIPEIDASNKAGFQTVLLDRAEDMIDDKKYNIASNFEDINIREKAA